MSELATHFTGKGPPYEQVSKWRRVFTVTSVIRRSRYETLSIIFHQSIFVATVCFTVFRFWSHVTWTEIEVRIEMKKKKTGKEEKEIREEEQASYSRESEENEGKRKKKSFSPFWRGDGSFFKAVLCPCYWIWHAPTMRDFGKLRGCSKGKSKQPVKQKLVRAQKEIKTRV